uniref:Uncharacterized protein n=1 Tax=Parascaris equorum TaxID=6256 RepID=A0A914RYA7_PAREQ
MDQSLRLLEASDWDGSVGHNCGTFCCSCFRSQQLLVSFSQAMSRYLTTTDQRAHFNKSESSIPEYLRNLSGNNSIDDDDRSFPRRMSIPANLAGHQRVLPERNRHSETSEINNRRMSQIHSFILSRLPARETRNRFLRELIDYYTPETQRLDSESPPPTRLRSLSIGRSTSPPREWDVEVVDPNLNEDGIPSSGLTIPPQIRSQLLGEQETAGGDSEEEMSESISELPTFAGQRQRKRSSQKFEPSTRNPEETSEQAARGKGDSGSSSPFNVTASGYVRNIQLKKTPPKKSEQAAEKTKFSLKKTDKKAEEEHAKGLQAMLKKRVPRSRGPSDSDESGSLVS